MNFEEWATIELFDYLVDVNILDITENFEDWKNLRTDLLEMCKDYDSI